MENLSEIEIRNYDLKILVEVTKALNESSSLQQIYNVVLEKASRIEKVGIIMIYLVDDKREYAELQAYKNVPDSYLKRASRIPYPKGFTWKVINSGVIHNLDDHSNEKSLGKAGRDLGTTGVLSVPIEHNNSPIGVVHFISYKKNKFTNRELDVLSTLGDQLSIAVSKARQSEEIRIKSHDLAFSRKQHRGLFENIPVGICRTDPTGEIITANNSFVELLGFLSFEELVKSHSNINDFCFDNNLNGSSEMSDDSDMVRNVESVWIRKDSTLINVIHNSHAVRDENGSIFYIENVIQDITVQKNMEIALNSTITELIKKNKYENIISSITKSLSESLELGEVMENTAELIQQNVEGADYLSIYLLEGSEAVLKTSRGYPDWLVEKIRNLPYPEGNTWKTISEKKIRYSGNLKKNEDIEDPLHSFRTRCFISIPIFSNDKVTGCINVSSSTKDKFDDDEISLLKVISRQIGISINNANYIESIRKSTRALAESEEKFRNTFENAAVGIALVDMQGSFMRVNEKFCHITGYSKGELFKTGFGELTHPDDLGNDREQIERLNRGEIRTYSVEKRYFHKMNHVVWVKLTVSLQKDVQGRPSYYIAVVEDISERKQYEMQLKDSIAEKEVLIKEIHHRVKNNLQIISSLMHLQSRKFGREISGIFGEMYDRIRIMALTHEQLYQSENLALINFENFIRSLIENLKYSYRDDSEKIKIINNTGNINFGINLAIPCGLIVNELLTNSIKYAFRGRSNGTITIDIELLDYVSLCDIRNSYSNDDIPEAVDFYLIRISDDGVGLPEDFELHESKTLGIQIVHDLVDQLNGSIKVYRENGTTFEIIIPGN